MGGSLFFQIALINAAGASAPQAQAPQQEPDEMEGIDPEFIAALPPDLQAEVLEQQRRERRIRQAARRAEAQQQVLTCPSESNFDIY